MDECSVASLLSKANIPPERAIKGNPKYDADLLVQSSNKHEKRLMIYIFIFQKWIYVIIKIGKRIINFMYENYDLNIPWSWLNPAYSNPFLWGFDVPKFILRVNIMGNLN